MRVLAIQTGKIQAASFRGKVIHTAIDKEPVSGPVWLGRLGLEGDEVADLEVHGGIDKALYAYGFDAYAQWKAIRPQQSFGASAMGENLTVETLKENSIFIGDTYHLGESLIQVSEPRFPCYKLGIKYDDQKILREFTELGRPGVYFRVLREGLVNVNDVLKLSTREDVLVPVTELFRIDKLHPPKPERAREILTLKSLTPGWRRLLESKI